MNEIEFNLIISVIWSNEWERISSNYKLVDQMSEIKFRLITVVSWSNERDRMSSDYSS